MYTQVLVYVIFGSFFNTVYLHLISLKWPEFPLNVVGNWLNWPREEGIGMLQKNILF